MENIKTISFDLWNTLIKSNPRFKKERIHIITNYTHSTISEINDAFENIKLNFNSVVEKFGASFTSENAYHKVFNILNIKLEHYKEIKYKCDQLFLTYPPLLTPYTKEILEKLSTNHELVISSNTMFKSGIILRDMLELLEIDKYFSHYYFSDELEVSKPHYNFFKQVHIDSKGRLDEILHIGDNTITDIKGASDYGFNVYEFSKLYNHTIKSLYENIK